MCGIGGRRDGRRGAPHRREIAGSWTSARRRYRAPDRSIGAFRARRARGELPGEAFGDVFLVVDGWQTLKGEFEQLEEDRSTSRSAASVSACTCWSPRPAGRRSARAQGRHQHAFELRLGDPMESEVDRKVAANVPAGLPGRGITREKLHFLGALPRIDGVEDPTDLADGVAKTVAAIAEAWQGPQAPKLRMLPLMVPYTDLPEPQARPAFAIPLGVDENKLEPVYLDFNQDPHFLMFGEGESGKTAVLRSIIKGITEGCTPATRRASCSSTTGVRCSGRARRATRSATARRAGAVSSTVSEIKPFLEKRQPGPEVTAEELRNRSWWSGPEIFVVVDDYDLVADASGTRCCRSVNLLPQARDIGLHLILARSAAARDGPCSSLLVQRLREMGTPTLLMSASKDEGQLFGIKPQALPAGRGYLIGRRGAPRLGADRAGQRGVPGRGTRPRCRAPRSSTPAPGHLTPPGRAPAPAPPRGTTKAAAATRSATASAPPVIARASARVTGSGRAGPGIATGRAAAAGEAAGAPAVPR